MATTSAALAWAGSPGALAALAAAVWFGVNVLAYLRAEKLKRQAKLEEARKVKQRKTFRLESSGEKGWGFKVGFGEANEFVGNGKGRASWVPGEEDVVGEAFAFDREENANSADRVYRSIMLERNAVDEAKMSQCDPNASQADQAATAAIRGAVFYSRLQTEDGFWPGDYGGPMFLLPGMVIACYVTNIELGAARKAAMLRYIMTHQQAVDGGWGMHVEGHSTVFGSTLNYTAARLLGLKRDDPRAVRGRDFIKGKGGAIAAPQWAKFWLATLGAYEWTGVNPTPPELWLLPYWFPFHPGRMWCHCRMVYLPMSALFGARYVYAGAESDDVVLSLREELYASKYESIDWGAFSVRECIADTDLFNPQSKLMTFGNHLLHHTIESPVVRALFYFPLSWLRRRALNFAFSYVHAEDKHTNWVDIGPVSKAFHIIATYARYGPDSPNFTRHIGRLEDYLWLAEDGLKMQGYNGSMFWDTCFATHAVANAVVASKSQRAQGGVQEEDRKRIYQSLIRASAFVDEMQVREDVEDKEHFFRDNSKGGWPFSTRDHGWPISDCTAEGVKAAILLSTFPDFERDPALHHISQERLEQAIVIILELQNTQTDNGWASYELNRGYDWYELLNPAQVFGDIMIDYSYVECSSAAVQALCEFAERYPASKLAARARASALLGADFIVGKQRKDGSWYGSWAVCFTYAAWFGVEGLVATLRACEVSAAQRAAYERAARDGCGFLLAKQREDGGWGESVRACAVQEWVENETGSQVVQTGWAVLALVKAAEYLAGKDDEAATTYLSAAERGCAFLQARQRPSGDWDQECVSGVFNKSCAITYTAYRNVFPVWALARFSTVKNNNQA